MSNELQILLLKSGILFYGHWTIITFMHPLCNPKVFSKVQCVLSFHCLAGHFENVPTPCQFSWKQSVANKSCLWNLAPGLISSTQCGSHEHRLRVHLPEFGSSLSTWQLLRLVIAVIWRQRRGRDETNSHYVSLVFLCLPSAETTGVSLNVLPS